jgi:hypothetical protein
MTSLIITATMAGYATEEPGVYRGGQRVLESPQDIQEHYSFRFVEKFDDLYFGRERVFRF